MNHLHHYVRVAGVQYCADLQGEACCLSDDPCRLHCIGDLDSEATGDGSEQERFTPEERQHIRDAGRGHLLR